MKSILAIISVILSVSVQAQVTFKWVGTTGMIISDQKTQMVFDPAMSRFPFYDYLPFRTVKSDPAEVDYWMNKCGLKSTQATFVNHAHTDHAIDAPYVVSKYGGKLYGSSSVVNIGLGQGLKADQVQQIKPGEAWKVGDFTITPYTTPHSPHIFEILFMDGHIEKPLPTPASVWDYRVGDTFSFLIKHPKGTILFQSIARIYDPDPLSNIQADVLLLTVANRVSTEHLIQKRLLPSKAKMVIPLHHDNFFSPMKRDGTVDTSWASSLDEFKETMHSQAKEVRINWPQYCQRITLLN